MGQYFIYNHLRRTDHTVESWDRLSAQTQVRNLSSQEKSIAELDGKAVHQSQDAVWKTHRVGNTSLICSVFLASRCLEIQKKVFVRIAVSLLTKLWPIEVWCCE